MRAAVKKKDKPPSWQIAGNPENAIPRYNLQVVKPARWGRPLKHKPEELYAEMMAYREWCIAHDEPFLVVGFLNEIGILWETWENYSRDERFFEVTKKARQLSEGTLVRTLARGKGNPIGSIFLLKNWHGYRDDHTIVHKTESIGEIMGKIDGSVIEGQVVERKAIIEAPAVNAPLALA